MSLDQRFSNLIYKDRNNKHENLNKRFSNFNNDWRNKHEHLKIETNRNGNSIVERQQKLNDVQSEENDVDFLLAHLKTLARTQKPLSDLVDKHNIDENTRATEAQKKLRRPSLNFLQKTYICESSEDEEEFTAQTKRQIWKRVERNSGKKFELVSEINNNSGPRSDNKGKKSVNPSSEAYIPPFQRRANERNIKLEPNEKEKRILDGRDAKLYIPLQRRDNKTNIDVEANKKEQAILDARESKMHIHPIHQRANNNKNNMYVEVNEMDKVLDANKNLSPRQHKTVAQDRLLKFMENIRL